MVFKKEFTIYKSDSVHVYINQCHNKGKKTKLFSIRRNDKKSSGNYLGKIFFSGAWRQYISKFDGGTVWSSSCKKKICEFEDMLNKQFRENREKIKRKNNRLTE